MRKNGKNDKMNLFNISACCHRLEKTTTKDYGATAFDFQYYYRLPRTDGWTFLYYNNRLNSFSWYCGDIPLSPSYFESLYLLYSLFLFLFSRATVLSVSRPFFFKYPRTPPNSILFVRASFLQEVFLFFLGFSHDFRVEALLVELRPPCSSGDGDPKAQRRVIFFIV